MLVMHNHSDNSLITTTATPVTHQGPVTTLSTQRSNELIFVGAGPIYFIGTALIHFIGEGYALQIFSFGINDKVVGFDVEISGDPFHISGYAMDYQIRESWGDVRV
jgi:hypothetical protein